MQPIAPLVPACAHRVRRIASSRSCCKRSATIRISSSASKPRSKALRVKAMACVWSASVRMARSKSPFPSWLVPTARAAWFADRPASKMSGRGRIWTPDRHLFEADLWSLVEDRPYLLWWIYNAQTCGS